MSTDQSVPGARRRRAAITAPAAEAIAGEAPAPRRAQILAAARAASESQGFGAVTMDAIAAAARVSKGTLYNHFASKEELLLAMVVDQFVAGGALVDGFVNEHDAPPVALAGITDGLVAMMSAREGQSSLLYQAWAVVAHAPEVRERLELALNEMFRSWSEQTRAVIERGQADGSFRRDLDAAIVADAISAIVSGFMFRSTFDAEAAAPERLREVFRSLLHERLVPVAAGR